MTSIVSLIPSAASQMRRVSPYQEGNEALFSRNLEKLKGLYEANNKRWDSFLKIEDVKRFLDSINERNDADPELVKWLDLVFPSYQISENISELITRAAEWGDEGLPLIQTLVPTRNCLYSPHRSEDLLYSTLRQGTKGLLLAKWLLEKGNFESFSDRAIKQALQDNTWQTITLLLEHKACTDHLGTLYRFALSLGAEGLPKMKLIWDKVPPTELNYYPSFISLTMRQLSKCPAAIPQFLDFILERMITQHGSRLGFSQCDSTERFSLEVQGLINAHLKKKGFEFALTSDGSMSINFRQVFQEAGPAGLPFFEEACRSMPQKLSNYTIRWAFIKAAANGEAGVPLMEWLAKNVPEKLSYWALEQAGKMLEKNKDEKTAEWLKTLKMQLFKDGAKSPVDNDDLFLQLVLSKNPSGYRPLGDTPERLGWKPLTQEELNKMTPKDALAPLPVDDLFNGMKIVEDTAPNPLPNEIRKSEAALFSQLLAHIIQGNTSIKIHGSEEFKKEVCKQLKILLARPSGRWLILFLCRSSKILPIRVEKETIFKNGVSGIDPFIGINFGSKSSHNSRNDKGVSFPYDSTHDTALFHEMIHAWHCYHNPDLYLKIRSQEPLDKEYDSLEEQYTIAGCDDDSILLPFFYLTENTYNCESGYFFRYGHHGDRSEISDTTHAASRPESKEQKS